MKKISDPKNSIKVTNYQTSTNQSNQSLKTEILYRIEVSKRKARVI